ncbi:MAG: VWA domain-containing protein [Chloroflexi bacterium]|nr:VWA domain-containing protein [Chloroflexota bacterium]
MVGARLPEGDLRDIALGATLRAAAPHQRARDTDGATVALRIEAGDWREAVRRGRTGNLVLFVVDASGSMGARQRMVAAKGTVLGLLVDAYQRRDRVGLIAFGGEQARLVLPPTSSIELAEQRLRELPTGGRTPLSHGLALALETLTRARSSDPEVVPLLVLVSDGRANVPLNGGDAVVESQRIAGEIAARNIPALAVDCETGYVRLALMRELSRGLDARYWRLEELTAEGLGGAVQAALRGEGEPGRRSDGATGRRGLPLS